MLCERGSVSSFESGSRSNYHHNFRAPPISAYAFSNLGFLEPALAQSFSYKLLNVLKKKTIIHALEQVQRCFTRAHNSLLTSLNFITFVYAPSTFGSTCIPSPSFSSWISRLQRISHTIETTLIAIIWSLTLGNNWNTIFLQGLKIFMQTN